MLVKNPLKSVIEISKFLFNISPSHLVTIGLKGYTSPKTVYIFLKNVFTPQPSVFTHINFSAWFWQMTYLLQPALLGSVDDVAGAIIST